MSWALIAILLFREPFFFTQSNLYMMLFLLAIHYLFLTIYYYV